MEEETEKKMTKKEFWIRFGIWFFLAVAVPFTYVACAYGLFENKGTTLSGWGVVALIFVIVMLFNIIKQARAGFPKGTMARQCIDGYLILIPIFGALLLVHSVKNSLAEFEKFLIVMILCEAVAVPVNPMPKWAAQNRIKGTENAFAMAFRRMVLKEKEK